VLSLCFEQATTVGNKKNLPKTYVVEDTAAAVQNTSRQKPEILVSVKTNGTAVKKPHPDQFVSSSSNTKALDSISQFQTVRDRSKSSNSGTQQIMNNDSKVVVKSSETLGTKSRERSTSNTTGERNRSSSAVSVCCLLSFRFCSILRCARLT
jgi:hypothetical protein